MFKDNLLLTRLRFNSKRLLAMGVIVGGIVIAGIGVARVFNPTPPSPTDDITTLPTPTPPQTIRDIGFGTIPGVTPPTTLSFDDPINVPRTIKVFRILPGADELFSPAGMVSVAKGFDFTGNASVLPTGDGFTYYEQDMKLTLSPNQGIASFSRDINSFEPQREVISPSSAIDIAKNFVNKIGFDNPLYVWQQSQITPHEIHGPGQFEEVIDIRNKGFYVISPRIQLLNLPIVLTQKVVVRVGSDGSILGAHLWYPHLDMNNVQEWEIIDYPAATIRARNNQGVYWKDGGLIPSDETMSFTTSELVYFVPNDLVSGTVTGNQHLVPVYRFSNNRTHLYVSALP